MKLVDFNRHWTMQSFFWPKKDKIEALIQVYVYLMLYSDFYYFNLVHLSIHCIIILNKLMPYNLLLEIQAG